MDAILDLRDPEHPTEPRHFSSCSNNRKCRSFPPDHISHVEITREKLISITKLCTTEREPWDSPTLIGHAMDHLSRYDYMLMLRAIWKPGSIHYQLVDIPIEILKLIGTVVVVPVGRRKGRKSLAADIQIQDEVAFHVHFDGADGKCQIRNLPVSRCRMLLEWDQPIGEEGLTLLAPE